MIYMIWWFVVPLQLNDALEWKNLRHCELVIVQNNPIFEDDDGDDDPYQHPLQKKLSEPTSNISADEFHLSLSKPIIKPWEEIRNNKHRIGIGYEKEFTFHIPNYTKPIEFKSVGFFKKVCIPLLQFKKRF